MEAQAPAAKNWQADVGMWIGIVTYLLLASLGLPALVGLGFGIAGMYNAYEKGMGRKARAWTGLVLGGLNTLTFLVKFSHIR